MIAAIQSPIATRATIASAADPERHCGGTGCYGYPKVPFDGGGNGTGAEGSDCLAHGNSDCAQGLLCLSTPAGNEYIHQCHNPGVQLAAGHYCAVFDSNNKPVEGACIGPAICKWNGSAQDVTNFTCK